MGLTSGPESSPDASSVSIRGERLLTDGEGSLQDDNVILVADDDEEFVETVRLWFEDRWDVRVAHDGDEAVDRYGPHVDAVLLDRRMPRVSGDAALATMRERDGDARIAMLTAVEPDWDILEMDFDMYLTKPVSREEAEEAIEELLERATYTREMRAIYSLSSKIAALEEQRPQAELDADPKYQRVHDELARLQRQADARLEEIDSDRFVELMQIVGEADGR